MILDVLKLWLANKVPVVVCKSGKLRAYFCAYLTVHCKKSTIHIIGSRKQDMVSDIIIKYAQMEGYHENCYL